MKAQIEKFQCEVDEFIKNDCHHPLQKKYFLKRAAEAETQEAKMQ